MRIVKFKDYVDGKWIEGRGYFHSWGQGFEELNDSLANHTFAIVENEVDGNVHEVAPHHLQFLDKPQT